jgi:hypothetical protein
MDSGVATRPIADLEDYRRRLTQFVYQSASAMQPVFVAAKHRPKKVIFAEGEDHRVLHAAQEVVDEPSRWPMPDHSALPGSESPTQARARRVLVRQCRLYQPDCQGPDAPQSQPI